MKSALRGRTTSDVEVTNIAVHGIWVLVDDQEFFLPYEQFPWFRDAAVSQILTIERPGREHLHWPDLDVDLTLDSIKHPERYPLVSKVSASRQVKSRPASRPKAIRRRARA